MSINIRKGNRTFRKALYSDFVVYSVNFCNGDDHKSVSIYISSTYGVKGFIAVNQVKSYDTTTHLVTFERNMSEKEILGYTKYISGITG